MFDQKVLESGGILLQSENLSETAIFKDQMRNCVNTLVELLEANNFTVVACEQEHKKVVLDEFAKQGINFSGSIDMVLQNPKGEPVIFDFKFSLKAEKYQDWIKENRAMQLALYRGLVKKATDQEAAITAYVLLPDVKVVTQNKFEGAFFRTDVNTDRDGKDLLQEIANSYEFRKNQILKGIVEDGEGKQFTYDKDNGIVPPSIDYVDQTQAKNLVPMELEIKPDNHIWKKKGNIYSKYKTFKAGK